MQHYVSYALEQLANAGLKITQPRRMLVELLAKSDKVLSPYDMKDVLEKRGIRADVVTIYRVMEVLDAINLVHKVLAFNGYIRCNTEKMAGSDCHHYLLCQRCHRVEEVEGENLDQLEKKIARNHHFQVQSHYLEFMGLCQKCNKKKK